MSYSASPTKAQRLAEFAAQLRAAPSPANPREALVLIASTLDQVEDDLTTIPFDPDRWVDDERMYAPQPDSARSVAGRPDITRYRTRAHNVFIAQNGACRITAIDNGKTLIDQPGADGCLIELD